MRADREPAPRAAEEATAGRTPRISVCERGPCRPALFQSLRCMTYRAGIACDPLSRLAFGCRKETYARNVKRLRGPVAQQAVTTSDQSGLRCRERPAWSASHVASSAVGGPQ